MFTLQFWKDAFERSIATFAQTLLALVGVDLTGWFSLNWGQVLVTSLIAAGLSIVKALAVSNVGSDQTPTIVSYEYPRDHSAPDDAPVDETSYVETDDEFEVDENEEIEWDQEEGFEVEPIPEQELTPIRNEG